MNQTEPQRKPTEFGVFLLGAADRAGFTSVTRLAHAADLDPSVVFRWIYGKTEPSAKALAKVAPLLGLAEVDLIARAYPASTPRDTGTPPPRQIARIAVKRAFTLAPDEEQTVVVTDQALRLSWLCTSGMFQTKDMLRLAEAVEAVMRLMMPPSDAPPPALPDMAEASEAND